MKFSTILVVLFSVVFLSFKPTDDWSLYKSQDGVEIYSKTEIVTNTFGKHKVLVFKYVNTTEKALTVSWKLNLYYGGVCRACDLPSPNEYEFSLNLNSKETRIGKADSESKMYSVFYSNESEGITPLDKFEFYGLKISMK